MSNTFIKIVALAACLVLLVGSIPVYGATYSTYTYSIDGTAQASPAAYTPVLVHDSNSLGLKEKPLNAPTSIETDTEGKHGEDGNIHCIFDIIARAKCIWKNKCNRPHK